MTKNQFDRAVAVARSGADLGNVDDSALYGCGLPNFDPVTTTVEVVAKFIRWQAVQLNGEIDSEALTECRSISRRKFLVCG